MQTIKANTKRGGAFVANYNRSTFGTLAECYGRFSGAKAAAENACRRWCRDENGDGFKIISFNTFSFSAAWRVAGGLRVETPGGSYLITF